MGTVNYFTSDYITMGLRPYDSLELESDLEFMEEMRRECEEYGGTIENCTVQDSSITSEMMAGGIAGQSADNAVISGCTVSGSVAIAATGLPEEYGVMTTSGAAGIVGGATGGEITDCLYLPDEAGSVTRVDGDVYGIAKLDNVGCVCLCTRRSLYLYNIGCGSA